MKRIKLRKEKNKGKTIVNKSIIILLLCAFCVGLLIWYLDRVATPTLLRYAELETRKLSTIIINRAISKNVASNINLDELIITTKNSNNEIQTVDFNPFMVNKILALVGNTITLNLKWLEDGKIDLIELPNEIIENYNEANLKQGIVYLIPLGVITKNSFLSNLGPKIPVRLSPIGSVESNVSTRVNEYGINNVILEILINVKVSESVNLPFASKLITIENEIPIAIKLIQGKIPEYYSNGLTKDSSIFSIPIEK